MIEKGLLQRASLKKQMEKKKNIALLRHHEASMLILLVTHLSEKSVTAPSLLTRDACGQDVHCALAFRPILQITDDPGHRED